MLIRFWIFFLHLRQQSLGIRWHLVKIHNFQQFLIFFFLEKKQSMCEKKDIPQYWEKKESPIA